MTEVTGEIAKFLKDKNASAIAMVPLPGPSQRGPTCGFYALSFVMNYWYQRSNTFGGDYAAKTEPLPVRTNVKGPPSKDPSSEAESRRKEQRRDGQGQDRDHEHEDALARGPQP